MWSVASCTMFIKSFACVLSSSMNQDYETLVDKYVTINLSQIDSVLTWPLSDPPLPCLCLNWLDKQKYPLFLFKK